MIMAVKYVKKRGRPPVLVDEEVPKAQVKSKKKKKSKKEDE